MITLPTALMLLTVQTPAPAPAVARSYEQAFDQLVASRPTADGGLSVENVVLRRGDAELALLSGRVAMLPPINGRSPGAVFEGRGRFRMVPPVLAEREQLERRLGTPDIDMQIRSAALFFSDDTEAELRRSGVPSEGELTDEVGDAWRQALDWMGDRDKREFDPVLLSALLNRSEAPVFHAHIRPRDGDPVFFRVDSAAREEISFGRKARGRGPDRYEVLTQYHPADHYTAEMLLHEPSFRLAPISAYRIRMEIEGGGDISVEASLAVTPAVPGAWVPLQLHPDLELDSVRSGDVPVPFSRGDGSWQLWLKLPDTPPGQATEVTLWYAGDFIERVEYWHTLKSSTGWYPIGGREHATFDLTFVYESKYALTSVGSRIQRDQDGDRSTDRWITDGPVPHVSFNFGEYEVTPVEHPVAPPIALHWSEYGHRRLRQLASDAGVFVLQQDDMEAAVGNDVARSVAFFQERFGALPSQELQVAEILGSHGQAFPGLIHLSLWTFQWTGEEGYDELFRAHEVAHQWWGLAVDPLTYHDTWLSEGLAEYSGLWYVQSTAEGFRHYTDILNDYREAIFDRSEDAGPVWLGPRVVATDDRESAEDYQTVVYQKGAWVFHMLRHLMMDLDQMDASAFDAMLQELYERYRGRRISTAEFRSIVEAHIGVDMGWFFRQWVYGTAVPTYDVDFTGKETAEGYRVSATVRQDGVPADFTMFVPILVDFGDDGWARLRAEITGPVTRFDLPLMPRRPDDVVFNDMNAVLAEVKQNNWR